MSERNENRPGYKKTKVGWIPVEWGVKLVGQLCSFTSGNGFRPRDWSQKGLPIIRIQNLNKGRKFNYFAGEPKSSWLVFPGDLLFAWAGVKGVSFGPTIWDGPKGVLNQHIYKVHPFPEVHTDWLFLALIRVTEKVERKAHGFKHSLLHVHKSDITGQNLPFPSLSEQKKIAEILSTWDKAIDQTRRLIDAKKRRKKALMQQLLTGEKRLPEFNGTWAECSLGDVFNERREVNGHNLQLLAITGSRGVIPASEIERKDSSNPDKSKYKIIRKGDVGYNTMRMWQGVSAVSDLDGIVSPAYTICIPKEDVNVRFMGYFFKFPPIVYLFWRYSQGLVSDTLNLKFNNFAKIKVTIPGLKEQQAITKVLSSADNEIVTLEKKLTALEKQKRGLMQKLLTGEVRVKV